MAKRSSIGRIRRPGKVRLPGRKSPRIIPAFPSPPRELMGQWVAYSRTGEVIASGADLEPVVAEAERIGDPDVSYQKLPRIRSAR